LEAAFARLGKLACDALDERPVCRLRNPHKSSGGKLGLLLVRA